MIRPSYQWKCISAAALAATAFILFTAALVPINRTIEFGADEGYELQKAWMLCKGFHLYGNFWNDQPPLHTAAIAGLFSWFGASVGLARFVSILSGGAVVFAVALLAEEAAGITAALFSAALLLSSSLFLTLGVSTMLELNASALALTSLLAVSTGLVPVRTLSALVSGVVMGFALQTKLTAAMYVPACLCVLFYRVKKDGLGEEQRACILRFFQVATAYAIGCVATVLAVLAFFPGELSELFSHFTGAVEQHFGPETAFHLNILVKDSLRTVPALLGVAVGLRSKSCSWLAATVLALTVLGCVTFHRPYWDYYYLHLLVPFAVLGGIWLAAAVECVKQQGSTVHGWLTIAKGGASCVTLVLFFCMVPYDLVHGYHTLRAENHLIDEEVIRRLAEKAGVTRWVFTYAPIYTFHARLLTPPELTVMPSKRLETGALPARMIIDLLGKYKPEQLVVFAWLVKSDEWRGFLKESYVAVFKDEGVVLYLRRDSIKVPAGRSRITGSSQAHVPDG